MITRTLVTTHLSQVSITKIPRIVAAAAAHATIAIAAPVATRASGVNDGVILNYLQTIENMENAFYQGAVAASSQEDSENAEFTDPLSYSRFKEVSYHDTTHVAFLTFALQKKIVMSFGVDHIQN